MRGQRRRGERDQQRDGVRVREYPITLDKLLTRMLALARGRGRQFSLSTRRALERRLLREGTALLPPNDRPA